MNNLKSYTEYAVSTSTTDFVIGFDFDYGTDAVNVTVDNVPASEAGYSVIYLNSTTIRLSPAVPSGVVRLLRETDIDEPDNQFTAGAKFIASNMDENFKQIRKSQQEVRDAFDFLEYNTLSVVEAAKDATDAAEAAAKLANDTAAEFQISSDAAEAAAVTAVSAAQSANSSANIAEAAATAATISAGVFDTPEAGVNPATGVADGAYFNVRSSSDESYIDEYQNVGGSAVATGKSYLSALGVQQQEKPASTIKDASGQDQQTLNDLFYKNLATSAFVDAYGADPTGVNSSVAGIREAMKATIKNIDGWQLVNGGVTGHVVFGSGVYKIDINNLLVFAESYKRSYVFSGAGRQNTILLVQHDGSADTWYLADSKVSQNIYATLFENLTIICSNKDKFVVRRFAGDGGSDKQCWFSNCNLGTVNGASGRFVIENNYGMTGVIDCDKDVREFNSDLTRIHMCLINVEQYVLKFQNTQSVDHRITSSYLMTNKDVIQSIAGGSVSISDSGIALKGATGGHVFHFLEGNYVSSGNKLYSATNIQMECVDSGLVKTDGATNAKCLFYGLNVSTGVSSKINKIRVVNRGSGYTSPPTVSISGTGTGATAAASISTGITGAIVTNGGTNYTHPPAVKITGDGTGAELQAIVSAGAVTGFTVINAGRGYTTATLTLVGGKNQDAPSETTQATATAVLSGVVDEITVTSNGSGYNYITPATVTLSGGGGTGATAVDVRTLPNFVDIHAPTKVFIENCGEGISQTAFGYTVRTEHQATNNAVGLIEMQGFNPTSILSLKKDTNLPVFANIRVTGDKTPSYICVDGVFQSADTDAIPNVTTHTPSSFIVGNGRGSNVTKNRNTQFFQIKGIGEYWPDTTTTNQNTHMQRFWLPRGTIIKGLLLDRPAQTYTGLPYKVYLEDTQGNLFAESDWLSKANGWNVYIPVNKVLKADTQLRLRGSAQGFRVELDHDGQALLEIA